MNSGQRPVGMTVMRIEGTSRNSIQAWGTQEHCFFPSTGTSLLSSPLLIFQENYNGKIQRLDNCPKDFTKSCGIPFCMLVLRVLQSNTWRKLWRYLLLG